MWLKTGTNTDMHRVIVELWGLSITSWGVMLVIAFVVGIWLAEKGAIKYGIPKTIIQDLSVVVIISGIVGGRVTYIIENWSHYAKYPGEMFKVWEGGLIFYGGLGLAVLFGIIFLKRKKVNILKVMDLIAPLIVLGLGLARVGCFLNGCCFGKPTSLPWGVVFPANSPPRWVFSEHIRIHPTQLYESIAGVCMFLILLMIEKKKRFSYGYLFGIFLATYGGWRFTTDFLRYYESKALILFGLTHSQIVSILMILVAVVLLIHRRHPKSLTKTRE